RTPATAPFGELDRRLLDRSALDAGILRRKIRRLVDDGPVVIGHAAFLADVIGSGLTWPARQVFASQRCLPTSSVLPRSPLSPLSWPPFLPTSPWPWPPCLPLSGHWPSPGFFSFGMFGFSCMEPSVVDFVAS